MKKFLFILLIMNITVFAFSTTGIPEFHSNIIDKIKITEQDIPSGFMYGKIPPFARKVLKNNPWMMDKNAIRRLTKQIYPGGNYNFVSNIHVTILSEKKNPFGDDIVCYIILFNSSRNSQKEVQKITNYVKYNKDRTLLIKKNNLVIFYHVDDVSNFSVINKIAKRIEEILKKS